MALMSNLSPRPISTGSKNGASRPWIRYVIGSSSSTEQARYTSDRMRTSSFRLLVASIWSRLAASSVNFTAAQLSHVPRPTWRQASRITPPRLASGELPYRRLRGAPGRLRFRDGVQATSRGGTNLVTRIVKPLFWVALATAATIIVAACGSTPTSNGPVTFKGTKKVGYSAPLTGQSALYGHAVSQALNLAADDINAKGGVNGYKIEMDIQDDGTTVPQAVSNTKNMILQDNVVALMGSVTSAQCLAESPIAKQNKVITIDATCNSWQLTMESDVVSPYWVSIVPNTYMEGTAAGRLAASLNVSKIFIVSPKYLFGISETNAFVAALKKANPSVQIVNDPSTWYVPFPTNPRWDSTINAIQADKPDLVYSNIFAADRLHHPLPRQVQRGISIRLGGHGLRRVHDVGPGCERGEELRRRRCRQADLRPHLRQPARLQDHDPPQRAAGQRRRDGRHHDILEHLPVPSAQGLGEPEG